MGLVGPSETMMPDVGTCAALNGVHAPPEPPLSTLRPRAAPRLAPAARFNLRAVMRAVMLGLALLTLFLLTLAELALARARLGL